MCDACTLKGGVTTEDEMFIMLGSYYCDNLNVPGQTCTGVCAGGVNKGQSCNGQDSNCPSTNCVATQPATCAGTSSSTGMWCASGRNRCSSCTEDADCGTSSCVPYTNN